MHIIEIIPEKKGRLIVCTDAGFSFPIYQKEAIGYQLEEGAEISANTWEEIRREILDKRAKKRALYLLQKMDRTEAQLRQKLKENRYPMEVIDCALEFVKAYHYVDDVRYASVYIRGRQNQKSRMQLKMGLRQKGISDDIIECALAEEYTEGEDALILQLLKKKHYNSEMMDQKEKYKIYQYLMRKGFSGESVRRLMKL
jgi:regulatory protein